MSSDAFALTVTVPETVVPAAGAVMVTAGAVVSPGRIVMLPMAVADAIWPSLTRYRKESDPEYPTAGV